MAEMRETLNEADIFRLLNENEHILEKYGVKRIGLFGSRSIGSGSAESDVDLLVEFANPTFDNYMDLSFSLEDIFNREVDLVTEDGLSPYIKPSVMQEIRWYEPR